MTEDALKYVFQRERASGLGISGERLQKALDALRAFDAANPSPNAAQREERAALVRTAGQRFYAYIVTREACGMSRHDDAIAFFQVPGEVQAKMGIM